MVPASSRVVAEVKRIYAVFLIGWRKFEASGNGLGLLISVGYGAPHISPIYSEIIPPHESYPLKLVTKAVGALPRISTSWPYEVSLLWPIPLPALMNGFIKQRGITAGFFSVESWYPRTRPFQCTAAYLYKYKRWRSQWQSAMTSSNRYSHQISF